MLPHNAVGNEVASLRGQMLLIMAVSGKKVIAAVDTYLYAQWKLVKD